MKTVTVVEWNIMPHEAKVVVNEHHTDPNDPGHHATFSSALYSPGSASSTVVIWVPDPSSNPIPLPSLQLYLSMGISFLQVCDIPSATGGRGMAIVT